MVAEYYKNTYKNIYCVFQYLSIKSRGNIAKTDKKWALPTYLISDFMYIPIKFAIWDSRKLLNTELFQAFV